MFTAEELSEEDQQLKSELDMLVERLTVCKSKITMAYTSTNSANQGIRQDTLQGGVRGNQRVHQDFDLIDDRRS